MNEIQRMLIEHQCQKLMALYATHLDTPDPDAFANLWTDDGLYKPAARSQPVLGRPAIREWMAAYPADRLVRHLVTNPVVDVLDEDNATGKSFAIVFRDPRPVDGVIPHQVIPRAVAEYTDTFRRTDEGWRFAVRYYNVNFLEEAESVRPPCWPGPG